MAEAAADGTVTTSERDQLAQIATLLDLPVPEVSVAPAPSVAGRAPSRTRHAVPSGIEATGARFQLSSGCRVVFTGAMSRPREEWARAIAEAGFITGSVTKNCAMLVAADPMTQSGKAKTALKHGIPIVTEAEFAAEFEAYLARAAA